MLKAVGRRRKGSAYVLGDRKAMTYVRYGEAEVIQDLGSFNGNGMTDQMRLTMARKKLMEILAEFPELRKEICLETKTGEAWHLA
ncbi:hypothetical protein ACFL6S_20745 [Candidatus Poribacteria bacterium]